MSAASAALLLALLLSSAGTSRVLAAGDLSEFAFRPRPGAHLPLASKFLDEDGRVVPLARFFAGKPVVLVLDYLRCKTLCGLGLENLIAALDALPLAAGRDFQAVVISIDPRDQPADLTAAKAKSLAAYHHSASKEGWHFLTGRPEAVREVADAVGFPYRYEVALDQFVHPAGFVVAAADGSISRYLLGIDTQPAEVHAALIGAAQGKAVGLVTRILLLCHGENVPLGRYSLAVEGALVTANLAATAGGIAVFVAIWRRRRG